MCVCVCGGNNGNPAPLVRYTRHRGSREPFINNEGKLISPTRGTPSPSPLVYPWQPHGTRNSSRGGRFLNVCASRLYLSLPSAVSRAPFHPRTLAPREGRTKGWISRRPVRNIPSPPASSSLAPPTLHPPTTLILTLPRPPFLSHEPAHVHPRGQRVRRVAWRPSTAPFPPPPSSLSAPRPLLTPLTAHKVRTVRG